MGFMRASSGDRSVPLPWDAPCDPAGKFPLSVFTYEVEFCLAAEGAEMVTVYTVSNVSTDALVCLVLSS